MYAHNRERTREESVEEELKERKRNNGVILNKREKGTLVGS